MMETYPKIAAAIFLLLIFSAVSMRMDRCWRVKHPHHKPFRWGYFQAIWAFTGGLVSIVYCVMMILLHGFSLPPSKMGVLALGFMMGTVSSLAGYELMTRKTKRARVLVVILTLNIGTWLIDVVYGSNRWEEFEA